MTSEKKLSSKEIKDQIGWKEKKLNATRKKIVTNFLLKLRKRGEEINESNFKELVAYFDLQNFWEKQIKYGSASSKCRAIRKIDDLNIEIPGSLISSLTYDRNPYLRKRARSYYMYFSEHNPFKFLHEDYDKTFNEWDKIEIHRILCRRSHDLPNLTPWIRNSQNNDFKCFLIDEMLHFNQVENCPYLIKMLNTKDLKLRMKVIYALGEMRHSPAEAHLLQDYHLQPQPVQHCIIEAIRKFHTGNSLNFLKEAFLNAYDTETKLILLKAIFMYGAPGKELFYQLKENSSDLRAVLFNHVSNPLIHTA